MDQKSKFKLFEAAGIELEYMIVDRDTLMVRPVADLLFFKKCGSFCADIKNGEIDWSNELVNHVIELKNHKPDQSLIGIDEKFTKNVNEINSLLKEYNAMLLPTAMHPFMNPVEETLLWQHEYKEIYSLYHSIFNCRQHGWANLQSMHLNLSFATDEEFARLHSAIRILMPIMPAIAASSPLYESKISGWSDSRMKHYLHHEEKMPSLMGKLIPEVITTEKEYYRKIFYPIIRDISLYDKDGIMDYYFMNSRGAIARFDRGSIEIRVIDIQECPAADFAIASLIIETLKLITKEVYSKYEEYYQFDTNQLYLIFNTVIKDGHKALIDNTKYLRLLGIKEKKIIASDLWHNLCQDVKKNMEMKEFEIVQFIIQKGTLSHRIVNRMGGVASQTKILSIYHELADCLENNELFQ